VTQEIHLSGGKGALFKIDDQLGCLEMAENLLHVPLVLLQQGAGNDDIVEVDEKKCQPSLHLIHELLEGAAGNPQAKSEA
jgi:hypothetical protein